MNSFWSGELWRQGRPWVIWGVSSVTHLLLTHLPASMQLPREQGREGVRRGEGRSRSEATLSLELPWS